MKPFPLRLWRDLFSELGWLIQHGIPLQSSLQLLLKQKRLTPLHPFLYHCLQCITEGNPLSSALTLSPQAYLFQAFVICGETSGSLDSALIRCAQWLTQRLHFQTQCQALLFYPVLLILLLVGGSLLLLGVIVPEFYQLYQAFNAPLPITMKGLWAAHLFLVDWGLALALGFILGGFGVWALWRISPAVHRRIETVILRIPAAHQLCHAHECAHLGMLLAGGIPIYQAFQLLITHARFRVHQALLSRILEALTRGQSLALAYHTVGWHDAYLCDMLRIAEHTGTLDKTYLKLCEYYTHQLDMRLNRFKQEWQPLIMLGMGALVGTWVLLLYYPLIQLGYAVG
ncbi:MAG: type II secretion system F family protein [Gammaproteobacteria bacterium]